MYQSLRDPVRVKAGSTTRLRLRGYTAAHRIIATALSLAAEGNGSFGSDFANLLWLSPFPSTFWREFTHIPHLAMPQRRFKKWRGKDLTHIRPDSPCKWI